MAKITIGTFNMENLFLRYELLDRERGKAKGKPLDYAAFKERGNINMLGSWIQDYYGTTPIQRALTARVIYESSPDIMAVQEVENIEALKQFNQCFIKKTSTSAAKARKEYPYVMAVDGNDQRQIDVGLFSRYEITSVRTHMFEPPYVAAQKRIFARDCLETQVALPGGKSLTIFINHFTSQLSDKGPRRKVQADQVAKIVRERFGASLGGDFIVAGDLNAAPDAPELASLLGLNGLDNVVQTQLPASEQWTYYYGGGKKGQRVKQFDYILLSRSLSAKNPKVHIERGGLSSKIKEYTGPRFVTDPDTTVEASTHCPVFVTLDV